MTTFQQKSTVHWTIHHGLDEVGEIRHVGSDRFRLTIGDTVLEFPDLDAAQLYAIDLRLAELATEAECEEGMAELEDFFGGAS